VRVGEIVAFAAFLGGFVVLARAAMRAAAAAGRPARSSSSGPRPPR
jgi:hypothetical protein